MKTVRWAAVAATVLMALMNVGVLLDAQANDVPVPLAVAIALLGLVGVVAAAGLATQAAWGRPLVVAVALVNLVAAVVAMVLATEGAVIGLVVSALGLALGYLSRDRQLRASTS